MTVTILRQEKTESCWQIVGAISDRILYLTLVALLGHEVISITDN